MSTDDLLQSFREAIAQDLALLASLHDRELDDALLAEVRQSGFPDAMGLLPRRTEAIEALAFLRDTLNGLSSPLSQRERDEHAVDYAAIYLTHSLSVSPYESVWCDEEGLAMQAPMFEVRDCYRRHGLGSADWRTRADDHLCLQLGFLAYLARQEGLEPLREACSFMDAHLLRWLSQFAARVSHRCDTAFYAGLAMLTAAYCEELRDILAELLGEPRVDPDLSAKKVSASQSREMPMRYMPGVAPSW
jgi:putative dimethyl sulfoxide reductase chaperone